MNTSGSHGLIANTAYSQQPADDIAIIEKVSDSVVRFKITDLGDYGFPNAVYDIYLSYSSDPFGDISRNAYIKIADDFELTTGKELYDLIPQQPEQLTLTCSALSIKAGEPIERFDPVTAKNENDQDITVYLEWAELIDSQDDFSWYGYPQEANFIEGKTYYLTASAYFAKDGLASGTVRFILNDEEYAMTYNHDTVIGFRTSFVYYQIYEAYIPFVAKADKTAVIVGKDGEKVENQEALAKIEQMFVNDDENGCIYIDNNNTAAGNSELLAALGEGGEVAVRLTKAVFDDKATEADDTSTIKEMVFDVTPFNKEGSKLNGIKVPFNLPVDPEAEEAYADVYHGDDFVGQYGVIANSTTGAKYIRVVASNFSPYSYKLTNIKRGGYQLPNTGVK